MLKLQRSTWRVFGQGAYHALKLLCDLHSIAENLLDTLDQNGGVQRRGPQNCFFFWRDADQFSELIYRVTVPAKQLNQASRFPFRLGAAPGSAFAICNCGVMCEGWRHVPNIFHAACVLHFLCPAENSYLAGRQAKRSTCKTLILRGFGTRPGFDSHKGSRIIKQLAV